MNNIWNQRIPTLLGLFLIVIGIGITTYIVQQSTTFFQHAAPSDKPQDIRITNITDTSFSVTYKTDAQAIGTISVGSTNMQTVFDERDQQSGVPQQYTVHSFTVQHLQQKTSYQFTILSGSTTYLNNGNPFSVTTFPTIGASPTAQIPLAGKILESDGSNPLGALLYVTSDNGQTLSTLVKSSGLYVLPLNTMRTGNGSGLLPLHTGTKLQLLITDGLDQSHVSVLVSGINPVPAITLSQNYDFTIGVNPIASVSGEESAFPTFPLDTTLQATAKILTPKTDNQGFTDQQPVFQGTAQPDQTVHIEIHSDQAISTQVTTDASGRWSYRPSQPLSPGQHTITIMTADASGILHTIQRSFTVYAAGSQVNQSATPSAQPTQSLPTATPIPPKAIPTVVAPTLQPTPTTMPTPTVTPQPAVQGTRQPVPPKQIPVTGNNTPFLIAGTGILTTIVGIILFIVSQGAVL